MLRAERRHAGGARRAGRRERGRRRSVRSSPTHAERPHADLVLHGGRIVTVDAARTWARPSPSAAAGSSRSGGDATSGRSIGPRRGSSSCAAGPSRRASGTPTSTRSRAGSTRLRCDLDDARGLDATSSVIAAYAAAHPDEPWIHGDGWSHGRLPGRDPAPRGPRPDRPRSPGLPRQPRRPRRVGQHRALERAGITAGHRRPARRPDRARPGRPPRRARSTRAPMDLVERLLPADDRRRARRGAAPRPGLPPRARDHRLAGRDRRAARPRTAYLALAESRRADRRASSARCGGTHDAAPSRSTSSSSGAARTALGRYAPTSVKLMQDGILENGTGADARAVPRRRRRTRRQPRARLHRPRGPRGRASGSMRSGSSRTSTPSATARSAQALDAVEAARRRTARPTRGRTSPTSRSSIPTTSRASGSSACSPTRSRYGPATRTRWTSSRSRVLGPERWRAAVPVPLAARAAGATLVMGSDWSVSTREPAARDGGRRRRA